MRLLQRFWLIIKLYYTGEGRYKVHPIFERCTFLFRNFTVVPGKPQLNWSSGPPGLEYSGCAQLGAGIK